MLSGGEKGLAGEAMVLERLISCPIQKVDADKSRVGQESRRADGSPTVN